MSTEPFDPALYTRAPVLTLATAITLGQALVDASPDDMPAPVKKAAKQLRKLVKEAQTAWAERQRLVAGISDEDTRLLDQEADGAWSDMRSRLQAYGNLPVKHFPKAKRADELVSLLFGTDGLAFLREAYGTQWATMDTLLKRIDKEKLAVEIDELAGPEFLKHIRQVHPRYGAMVKNMLQGEASGPNLLEHVRVIQRAVVVYATRVCGTVEDDEEATVVAARKALAPIEEIRQASAERREKPAENGEKVGVGGEKAKSGEEPKAGGG